MYPPSPPLDETRRVLGELVASFLDDPSPRALLFLRRLADSANRLPFFARVVAEAVTEATAWNRSFKEAVVEQEKRLRAFRREIHPLVPAGATSNTPTADAHLSLAHFDRIDALDVSSVPDFHDQSSEVHNLETMAKILWHQVTSHQLRDAPLTATTVAGALEDLSAMIFRLQAVWRTQCWLDPGRIWEEIVAAADAANPQLPGMPLNKTQVAQGVTQFVQVEFMLALLQSSPDAERFGLNDGQFSKWRLWKGEMNRKIKALAQDFSARLGSRASKAWVLKRYVERCIFHQRELLVADAARGGKIEDRLVADAADFLFGHGLDVLTRLSLGVSEFDLVEYRATSPLLVEAKQYRDASGQKNIIQGVWQLHDYATRLRGARVETENFLLVYRLGGPRYAFPPEAVTLAGIEVSFILVDLAPAEVSGRKAPAPVSLDVKALHAAIKGQSNPGKKKSSKKAGGRKN